MEPLYEEVLYRLEALLEKYNEWQIVDDYEDLETAQRVEAGWVERASSNKTRILRLESKAYLVGV